MADEWLTWGWFKRWIEQDGKITDDTPLMSVNLKTVLPMFGIETSGGRKPRAPKPTRSES